MGSFSLGKWLLGIVMGLFILIPSLAAASLHSQETLRLSDFSSVSGPVKLKGIQDQVDLFIPLASIVDMKESTLDLSMVHSTALLSQRSMVRVIFNETTLAQIPINPKQPISKAKVTIPAELWRAGFNKLSLSVIQHYTDRCEDSSAPELWTEIDLYNSHLTYTLTADNKSLQLKDLSGLFSPGLGGTSQVQILTAPDADLNNQLQQALPMVAQAVALRRQYAGLQIEHAEWSTDWQRHLPEKTELKQGDILSAAHYLAQGLGYPHILVGTQAELAGILPESSLAAIQGPYLHLARVNPVLEKGKVIVPGGIRLIVSGQTPQEVTTAARVLAEMDDALNPIASVNILERNLGDKTLPLASKYYLQAEKTYSFKSLGLNTANLVGDGIKRVSVNLPIKPDFYTHENARVDFELDFGYGAGLGEGSIMNVYLNGEYIHGLALNDVNGAAFRGYRIGVPSRKLLVGTNVIDFEFSLRTPTVAGECRSIAGSHLIAQILESSTVTLPKAGEAMVQPNLAAFASAAFPYINPSRVEQTHLVVLSKGSIGSGLTLAGKLAQVAQVPSEQLLLSIGAPTELSGHTLMLGTPNSLSADIYQVWFKALENSYSWPYRMLNDLRDSYSSGRLTVDFVKREPMISGYVTQDKGLGELGVMVAMKNPLDMNTSTLTLLVAESEKVLAQRIEALVSPQIWGQVRGDFVVWQGIEDEVMSMQVAAPYEIGARGSVSFISLGITNNPWYWLIGLLISVMLLAWLSKRYLDKRTAKKLAE